MRCSVDQTGKNKKPVNGLGVAEVFDLHKQENQAAAAAAARTAPAVRAWAHDEGRFAVIVKRATPDKVGTVAPIERNAVLGAQVQDRDPASEPVQGWFAVLDT